MVPRLAERARIVLACAEGMPNARVAAEFEVSTDTVRKWRSRFVDRRMAGLADEPRLGRRKAELVLSDAERAQLTRWSRRAKTAQFLALRAPQHDLRPQGQKLSGLPPSARTAVGDHSVRRKALWKGQTDGTVRGWLRGIPRPRSHTCVRRSAGSTRGELRASWRGGGKRRGALGRLSTRAGM
ncbi:helix-turn-helix domain-containing protein [Streptomyces sp. NPDC059122]|uniref:helix-turn-helix domain-containing protein n=1 Tax=Streptomyces sp. NPDC059122 TaxID=3346732 RepID=UPI00367D73CB